MLTGKPEEKTPLRTILEWLIRLRVGIIIIIEAL